MVLHTDEDRSVAETEDDGEKGTVDGKQGLPLVCRDEEDDPSP